MLGITTEGGRGGGTLPCAWEPTTKTGVVPSSSPSANSRSVDTLGAVREKPILWLSAGRCLVTGPFTTCQGTTCVNYLPFWHASTIFAPTAMT